MINGDWYDLFRISTAFGPLRAMNAAHTLGSFKVSRWSGSPVTPGMPIAITVEPTTSCNLRCPECPSGLRSFSRPTGMLDPLLLENLLKQVHRKVPYLTLYFQGEPFLHPEFLDLVRIAKRYGMYTATSTNAHYLNEETARSVIDSGLDRLIISIDGVSQSTYEQYRVGGSLEKVLLGARNLVAARKSASRKPYLVFQFLVVRPNEHQVDEVRELARSIGVDRVVFKTAQLYDHADGHPLMPVDPRYSRYQQGADGKWRIKNTLDNHCWRMWHSCVMTWDGKIVPCCFDKDASHVMGDLNTHSFREIWFGEAYKSFRQQLLRGRDSIDICRNCSEGTKVFAS
ncbi:MAG: SPASM domain-containing protein [Bacteroidota bacterium]